MTCVFNKLYSLHTSMGRKVDIRLDPGISYYFPAQSDAIMELLHKQSFELRDNLNISKLCTHTVKMEQNNHVLNI